MSNANTFLEVLNTIEQHIRDRTEQHSGDSFSNLVDIAARSSAVIRRYRDDLKEFADLRRAIVHERVDGHIVAEPHDLTLAQLKHIADLVLQPPCVFPMFKREVLVLYPDDTLAQILGEFTRQGFSQAPIYDDTHYAGMLTTNTIARWLGGRLQDGNFNFSEARVSDAMAYAEPYERVEFITRETTLAEVSELFVTAVNRGQLFAALLITATGKPDKRLLGIVTGWDLPEINRHLL